MRTAFYEKTYKSYLMISLSCKALMIARYLSMSFLYRYASNPRRLPTSFCSDNWVEKSCCSFSGDRLNVRYGM